MANIIQNPQMSGRTRRRTTLCAFRMAVALAAALPAIAEPPAERPEAVLERSSAELAATLALNRFAQSLSQAAPDNAPLVEEMSSNPGRYADPDSAERDLRGFFAKRLSARYAEGAGKVLARLAGERTADEAFDRAFLAAATNAPKEIVDGYVAAHYADAFKAARRTACRRQAERIASRVRPSEREIDDLASEELARQMTERVAAAQDEPVFRENLKYIASSVVKPMLEDAYNQRDFQNAVARNATPAGYAPSAIASNVAASVREAVGRRRAEAEAPETVYGVFPSVLARTVPERAEGRAAEILDQAAAAEDVPLDASAIALAIAENPSAHRRLADSRKAFEPGLAERLIASATEKVLAAAPEAERAEAAAFAKGHFAAPAVAEAIGKRVSRTLDERLRDLRAAFAEVQCETFLPQLAAGDWIPAPELVDAVAESNDFRKVLSRWRDMDALGEFRAAEAANPFLEEASQRLDKLVVDAFEPGAAALACQHGLADSCAKTLRAELGAGAELPPLPDLVARLTGSVSKGWSERRASVLGEAMAAKEAYADLFPSTRRKIELLARAMMEAPTESPPETEEKPPETPPQDAPPPETLEEIALDCRIVFTRAHEEIVAEVIVNEKPAGRFTCPYPPSGYRRSSSAFSGATAKAVSDVVAEATRSNRVALTVLVDVKDPLIYHGAVADTSWLLKQSVDALGEYVSKFEINESR